MTSDKLRKKYKDFLKNDPGQRVDPNIRVWSSLIFEIEIKIDVVNKKIEHYLQKNHLNAKDSDKLGKLLESKDSYIKVVDQLISRILKQKSRYNIASRINKILKIARQNGRRR